MSQNSEKKYVEKEFKVQLQKIGKAFSDFPWEDEEAYCAWLAQTYFYVSHTTSMICLSAAKFGPRLPKKFEQALHHLSEERGHDLLLINDLDQLGRTIGEFAELPDTELFYQNQYYMIQNEGPTSHLGYALLLESMCATFGPDVLRRVRKSYGANSITFLDVHVTADQDHSAEGLKVLLDLEPQDATRVIKNMKQTALLYERILGQCAEHLKNKSLKAA